MYTDRTQVETFIGKAVSLTDTQLEALIAVAESQVNAWSNRYKLFSDTPETRKYRGKRRTQVAIDNILFDETISVTVNGVATTQFTLDRFFMESASVLDFDFYINPTDVVEVTATFGVATTLPKEIAQATTMLVAELLEAPEAVGSGAIQRETIGKYSVQYQQATDINNNPVAKLAFSLLDKYIKLI